MSFFFLLYFPSCLYSVSSGLVPVLPHVCTLCASCLPPCCFPIKCLYMSSRSHDHPKPSRNFFLWPTHAFPLRCTYQSICVHKCYNLYDEETSLKPRHGKKRTILLYLPLSLFPPFFNRSEFSPLPVKCLLCFFSFPAFSYLRRT